MSEEREIKRVPPPREIHDMPIGCVYAAPDIMLQLRAADSQGRVEMGLGNDYPFNQTGFVEKGMASADSVGTDVKANAAESETIVCPECGEKTRNGKFCEYCGHYLR